MTVRKRVLRHFGGEQGFRWYWTAVRGRPSAVPERAELDFLTVGSSPPPPPTQSGRRRGGIQLTGRSNYEAFNSFYQTFAQNQGWAHPNVLQNPGHVATNVRAATMAALHFWKNNVDGEIEGDLTVKKVTHKVNGGEHGLDTRETEFEAIKNNVNCSN